MEMERTSCFTFHQLLQSDSVSWSCHALPSFLFIYEVDWVSKPRMVCSNNVILADVLEVLEPCWPIVNLFQWITIYPKSQIVNPKSKSWRWPLFVCTQGFLCILWLTSSPSIHPFPFYASVSTFSRQIIRTLQHKSSTLSHNKQTCGASFSSSNGSLSDPFSRYFQKIDQASVCTLQHKSYLFPKQTM